MSTNFMIIHYVLSICNSLYIIIKDRTIACFALNCNNQYHLAWETLNTEEATYIWHFGKSVYELERNIKQIDGLLGQIRTAGRQLYLETNPDHFSRIVHDYTGDNKGFIVWKDSLEEKLF